MHGWLRFWPCVNLCCDLWPIFGGMHIFSGVHMWGWTRRISGGNSINSAPAWRQIGLRSSFVLIHHDHRRCSRRHFLHSRTDLEFLFWRNIMRKRDHSRSMEKNQSFARNWWYNKHFCTHPLWYFWIYPMYTIFFIGSTKTENKLEVGEILQLYMYMIL